jgi:hypothetical protein
VGLHVKSLVNGVGDLVEYTGIGMIRVRSRRIAMVIMGAMGVRSCGR